MSTNKNAIRRELYSKARKYLDMKSLFPNSEYVGRAPLTDYQAKKISKELRHLIGMAGGEHYLEKDFVKVRRTKGAREYIENNMLPKSAKGILLPGGEKINKGVSIKGGAVHYLRGDAELSQYPLDARTEKTLEKSIRQHGAMIERENNFSYIGTSGGKISGVEVLQQNNRWKREPFPQTSGAEEGATDQIVNLSLSLYLKYAAMAKAGEFRKDRTDARGRVHTRRKAAHPKKWGMTLIIEKT